MIFTPNIITFNSDGEKHFDVFSKLYESRKIFLSSPINDDLSLSITAQLLLLAEKDPTKDIELYINSPGGVITSGFAIYDTIKSIPCDVSTICMGQACSMGSFLLSSGTKGKRKSYSNSRIMIHQPSGGTRGQHTDIEIQYKEISKLKEILTKILADNCGKKYEKVFQDCERDYFMSAEESKEYGLIDTII